MNIKPLLLLAIYLAVASCGMHTTSNTPVVDMDTASYFSSDYFAARQTFLDNAFAAEAAVVNYQNPHPGPDGRPLFTDVAACGPEEAENALVLMSGLPTFSLCVQAVTIDGQGCLFLGAPLTINVG